MDKEKLILWFTKSDKILLGVCGRLGRQWNFPVHYLRIIFIILTLFLIPLGFLLYGAAFVLLRPNDNSVLIFGMIGGILGIPLSYFFQSEMVQRMAGGIFGYIRSFTSIVDQVDRYVGGGIDVLWNAFLGIICFGVLGIIAGYYFKSNSHKK